MYVSKTKMDDLIARFPPSVWKRLSGTAGVAIPPVKLDVTLSERLEKQSALRDRIENALRKQGRLGSVDHPPPRSEGGDRYVVGDLVMRWSLHEDLRPQIVWFVGSTGRTLVALGGRARHLTAVYQDELRDKAPEWAKLKHVEKSVVAELARRIEPEVPAEQGGYSTGHWVHDVVTTHDYWASETANHVRFLAVVEDYCRPGELGPSDPSIAVLLGSPVYVFKIG